MFVANLDGNFAESALREMLAGDCSGCQGSFTLGFIEAVEL